MDDISCLLDLRNRPMGSTKIQVTLDPCCTSSSFPFLSLSVPPLCCLFSCECVMPICMYVFFFEMNFDSWPSVFCVPMRESGSPGGLHVRGHGQTADWQHRRCIWIHLPYH